MSIVAFWAHSVSSDDSLDFHTGCDGSLIVSQVALSGPCSSTTSLSVQSVYAPEQDGEAECETSEEFQTEQCVVTHLTWGRKESTMVNLSFGPNERITFSVKGDGVVHLTGHFMVEESEEEEEYDLDELESMDDDKINAIENSSDMEEEEDEEMEPEPQHVPIKKSILKKNVDYDHSNNKGNFTKRQKNVDASKPVTAPRSSGGKHNFASDKSFGKSKKH